MKRKFIIGLMLTLGSASTIAICSASSSPMKKGNRDHDTYSVTEIYLKGANQLYTGEMKDGEPNGQGKLLNVLTKALVFEGKFVHGNPNGHGTSYQPDGRKMEGEWMEGFLTQGIEYDTKGNKRYSGGWIWDEAKNLSVHHGVGKRFWANGKVKLDGTWDHGRFIEGTRYSEYGVKVYKGQWGVDESINMYVQHGLGTMYYSDNIKYYDGAWLFGKKDGKGTLFWENGNICYDGFWKLSKRHEKGTLFWDNGNKRITGTWENDLPNDMVTAYYIDGVTPRFEGYVKNGKEDTARPCWEYWPNGYPSHFRIQNSQNRILEDQYYRPEYRNSRIGRYQWELYTQQPQYAWIDWLAPLQADTGTK